MPPSDRDSARMLRAQKRQDAAMLLPFIGIVLFASPLLALITGSGPVLGVPLVIWWIFGGWFALVIAAQRLGRSLRRGPARKETFRAEAE